MKLEPRQKQINTYERLRLFWRRFYSAHYMTLAVQSKGAHASPVSFAAAAAARSSAVFVLQRLWTRWRSG